MSKEENMRDWEPEPHGDHQSSAEEEENGDSEDLEGAEWEDWLEILQSQDHRDRLVAARHLADAREPAMADRLAHALAKEDQRQVRLELGVALGLLNDPRAVSGLEAILEERRPTDLTALALLARLGSSAHLDRLRTSSRRYFLHPLVRVRLAATMACLGDGEGLSATLEGSQDRRMEVRGYSLELLGEVVELAPPWSPGSSDNRRLALDRLIQAINNPREPARPFAVRGLRHSNSPEAKAALQDLAQKLAASSASTPHGPETGDQDLLEELQEALSDDEQSK